MARKPNPELIDDGAPELRGGGFPRSRRAAPADRHCRLRSAVLVDIPGFPWFVTAGSARRVFWATVHH